MATPSPMYSERGKIILLHENYKFSKAYVSKNGNARWRCIERSCRKVFYTRDDDKDYKIIMENPGEIHNHRPSEESIVSRQIFSNSAKRKAVENLSERPLKIIHSELKEEQFSELSLSSKDLKCARRNIYHARRKTLPKSQQEVSEALSNLNLKTNFKIKMEDPEEFIKAFHALEGTSVIEKRKNLTKLLHGHREFFKNEVYLNKIVQNLKPLTYLEEKFHLEVLLFTKRAQDLLEILKNGNLALQCKILKHAWFMEVVFKNCDSEKITKEILPTLSYTVRCKVVKKLATVLEEQQLNDLFIAMKKIYGLPSALTLLPSCSKDFIETTLKESPIFMSYGQLKRLIDKDATLFILYLEEYKKHRGDYDFLSNRLLLSHLFVKNVNLFNDLVKNYKLNVILGRRISKSYVKSEKDEILAKPKKYVDLLNKNALIRKSGELGIFKEWFQKMLPITVENFDYDILEDYVERYPKEKRFNLLETAFEKAYNVPLINCVDKISDRMLDLINEPEKRKLIIDKKLSQTDDKKYFAYKGISESIPYFKKELNLCAKAATRRELINHMVKTCQVNKDYAALAEVVKFINSRHRNDDRVISDFLSQLECCFKTEKFTEEIWIPLFELLKVQIMKDQITDEVRTLLLEYYRFLYNKGKLTRDNFMYFMKSVGTSRYYEAQRYKTSDLKFLKTYILYYIQSSSEMFDRSNDYYQYVELLYMIKDWNRVSRRDKIDYFEYPDLIEGFKNHVENSDSMYFDVNDFLFAADKNNEIIKTIISEILQKFLSTTNGLNLIRYLLRHVPTILQENCDEVLEALHFKSYEYKTHHLVDIFKRIKELNYLGLDEKVIQFCKEKLPCDDCDYRPKLFIALSILLKPSEYIELTKNCKPENLINKDVEDPDMKNKFDMQSKMVKSFGNIIAPNIIPEVFNYCGGDYLNSALVPLYKLFSKIPMIALQKPLGTLMESSVSVRKHALFLASSFCDLESITAVFRVLITTEKNATVQKRFILTSLTCLKRFGLDHFWDYFQKYTNTFLDENDSETIEILTKQKYVPLKYKALYYELIWNVLQKMNYTETRRYELKKILLNSICSDVEHLSSEFCFKIIEDMFLNFSPSFVYSSSEINQFINHLLSHKHTSDLLGKISNVMLMRRKPDELPEDEKLNDEIVAFIKGFCYFYLNREDPNMTNYKCAQEMSQLLNTSLSHLIDLEKYFSLHILVRLLVIISEMKTEKTEVNITQYASKVFSPDGGVTKDSIALLDIVMPLIIDSVAWFCNDQSDVALAKLKMAKFLVTDSEPSEHQYYMAIKMLKSCKEMKNHDDFKKCLELLTTSSILSVRIMCYHCLIKN